MVIKNTTRGLSLGGEREQIGRSHETVILEQFHLLAERLSQSNTALVEALKLAEKTGKNLPAALTALGIEVPPEFSAKRDQVLAARDQVLSGQAKPSVLLPWQLEWYAGAIQSRSLLASVLLPWQLEWYTGQQAAADFKKALPAK